MIEKKTFWSACLGNLFEHYDKALFSFLSPFLAPLIFPKQEPLTALILTYGMIPFGMLARPVGSIVFGYIGDVHGRRQALFLSLAGMAVISGMIALSPTYYQAGVLAPIIFCLGRIMQNFFAAGETMGGAIFLLENAPEKHRDLLSSLYNASTIGGILLASAGVFALSYFGSIETKWRWLYVFGCSTALFACLIRRNPSLEEKSQSFEIKNAIWTCRKPLFLIAVTSGFAYANYSMALVLLNGFVPLISPLTKAQMMSINTPLLILDFCTLPFFGWLASKVSREKMMLTASLGVVLTALPLFSFLQGITLGGLIVIRVCFVLFGVAFFAPFHAWAQQLLPAKHRYAVTSFGYAIGSQLLGGPTTAISLWCFKKTGIVASVAWYWVILATLASFSLIMTWKEKKVYA